MPWRAEQIPTCGTKTSFTPISQSAGGMPIQAAPYKARLTSSDQERVNDLSAKAQTGSLTEAAEIANFVVPLPFLSCAVGGRLLGRRHSEIEA